MTIILNKNIKLKPIQKVQYHLPGLFEFFDFYKIFLKLYREHHEYFYDWCEIASIYGSPKGALWGGGRTSSGDANPLDVATLLSEYQISARLTFSNSQLKEEHLTDYFCNKICQIFNNNKIRSTNNESGIYKIKSLSQLSSFENNLDNDLNGIVEGDIDYNYTNQIQNTLDSDLKNGVIIYSDLLLKYLMNKYHNFYFISSTTKVITNFDELYKELARNEFLFVVPDFRFNKQFNKLAKLPQNLKDKIEFLCNECCYEGCKARKICYENVSLKNLGENCIDHECKAPNSKLGYKFSRAMKNPLFIGLKDIQEKYVPLGFSNFKIEGRELGSALLLEFLLYYMIKPEYHINVREDIYLDSNLDLF